VSHDRLFQQGKRRGMVDFTGHRGPGGIDAGQSGFRATERATQRRNRGGIGMGSQMKQPAMVRAHSKSGRAKSHNVHYVKLSTQDVVVGRQSGTRAPQSCHIWNTTPCPPTPPRLLYSPPRNYFPKNHERPSQCPI